MTKFYELLEKVMAAMETKTDDWGCVTEAFVTSEKDFELLSEYHSCANDTQDIDKNYYRGTPDWYFFEGDPGDMYGPSTYCFETLTEKKEAFEQLIAKYPYP